ncbi:MAG: VanZ family protein [Planctomycetes bacterium]|nr:VanZ family protein [Planctomycetota bacterium]
MDGCHLRPLECSRRQGVEPLAHGALPAAPVAEPPAHPALLRPCVALDEGAADPPSRWGAAIAALYGVSDELHQLYVPGRFASVTDVLLDVAGALLALFWSLRRPRAG